jgi:hypothetical protein
MWPTLTKAEVSKELMLEIEAGSSGRPNQAQELQNYERLAPILMQIPGINPLVLAKEAIKRLDDRIDVEAAVAEGMPSIQSMNAMKGPPQVGAPGPAGPPQAQGPQGGNNAPTPPPPSPSSPSPKPQGAPQGLMGT